MMRLFISAVMFMLTFLFGFAYYDRYFKWRDCFNELGRCFDPETGTVMMIQAGGIWGALMVLCFLAALWQLWRIKHSRT